MIKITTAPDPRLRKKSSPITKLDKAALKLINDLKATLESHNDPDGVGLSAPQIGVNKRVFVIKTDMTPLVIINPEILEFSKDTNWDHLAADQRYFEGCLSIPGVYGEVTRPWSIKVKYQTTQTDQLLTVNCQLTGYDAIYFQHEFDHLEGVLFTDHVLAQGGRLYQQTAKGEFDEIK